MTQSLLSTLNHWHLFLLYIVGNLPLYRLSSWNICLPHATSALDFTFLSHKIDFIFSSWIGTLQTVETESLLKPILSADEVPGEHTRPIELCSQT